MLRRQRYTRRKATTKRFWAARSCHRITVLKVPHEETLVTGPGVVRLPVRHLVAAESDARCGPGALGGRFGHHRAPGNSHTAAHSCLGAAPHRRVTPNLAGSR